jgi:OOP family OmpA-OmpF porin
LDTDLDGVPDGLDKCPDTPAGTKVDATGCPLPIEAVKPPAAAAPAAPTPPGKCPPAPPGSQVDANGCLILFAPEAAPSPTPGAPVPPRPTLILTGVNFETGRSVLTRDSYFVLDAVAASLLANPDIRIEVAGYTDSTGRKFMNLRLSQARAAAVRFYLARKGVPPARMVAKGYGASGYIAPNNTAAARAQNRRVELHKLP